MTDADLDIMEAVIKTDELFTSGNYISTETANAVRRFMRELISDVKQARKELRQTQKERDWLAKYIIEHGGCPSKDIWEKCTAEQDETNLCTNCWLKAAKEAISCLMN